MGAPAALWAALSMNRPSEAALEAVTSKEVAKVEGKVDPEEAGPPDGETRLLVWLYLGSAA